MKIKYLFLAVAMTVATSASAQFVGGGSSKGGSKTSNTELDPKAHFVADFKIGSVASAGGFGFNLGGTKELTTFSGCTLAWDFLNFEWAAPFNSPANLDMLSLKTGLRLFSPSFANDNIRLYTNLSMGYTCVLTKGASSNPMYEYVETAMGLGSGGEFKNWLEEQGYNEDEAKEIVKQVREIEDKFEDEHDDEEFANEDEWLQALLDSLGGGKMQANHGFGLTWGVGVQIKKKFHIGYTLQYETAFKSKNHFATIGYTF